MKVAFLFPGQGSQKVGMGKDIYDNFVVARNIYDRASEILSKDVAKLCFESLDEDLMNTENAQLSIFITSLAILEVLKEKGYKADMCAGLSLGEYSALIYGGYISLEEGIKLINRRGYLMGNFAPKEDFSMVAVIGCPSSIIENICMNINNKGLFVTTANYNYSGQTVISGNLEAVEMATKDLMESGASKVIKLKTSGAFHTSKLLKASEAFCKDLEKVDFKYGNVPVIKNIDGMPYSNTDDLKEILAKHIISPVRFDKTITYMKNNGVDTFVEIGPGRALTGFVRKELSDVNTFNICSLSELDTFCNTLK